MEHTISTIKTDFYNVFIEGNAKSAELARIFMIIGLALIIAVLFALKMNLLYVKHD